MKQLSTLFFYLAVAALFVPTACTDGEEGTSPFLTLEKNIINFADKVSTEEVVVSTNIEEWSISLPSDADTWVKAIRRGTVLQISVTENTGADTRSADVTVRAGDLSETLTVNQMGIGPAILLNPEEFTLSADEAEFSLEVTSNIEYEVIIPEEATWIKEKEPDTRAAGMVMKTHLFTVSQYRGEEDRVTEITVRQKTDATPLSEKVTVTQKAYYSGGTGGDVKDDVKVPISSATASSFESEWGEKIERSFDGDFSTLYHSLYDNKSEDYFPITLDYRFLNQESIDYLIYYPRREGLNGNFKEVEIWAATESEPELKKLKVHDFGGAGTPTKVLFDKPLVKPTTIRFVVNSGAGDGQGFASCAEMEFYRSNPDNYDPLQLFTDPSCSALKPGITREVIEQVSNNLYRNIAFDLFANRYPAEFRIQEYSAWPNPLVWEKVNKASSQSLLDNPTGIAVSQGEELVVFVGDTHGYNLSIKVQNLDKPGGDGYHSEASFYPLTKGVNKIRTDRKGLVYLFYHTADYEKAPKVKVHFATGKVNGYFDSQKHSDEDWRRLLDGATDKYFDVLGRHSHFTFETAAFKTYTTNGRELTDTYDELVRMEYEFMGLMKYNRLPVNRAYFHIMYSSYMYATAYRTAYLNTLQDLVLSPQRLKKDPWGPAHEMGHTLQTRPGFRWVGTVEVTNNLHSIYVQTQWGNSARLETDAPDRPASVGGKYNNVYERAYYDSFVNGIAHGDDKNDWFCMLVPLWQLQRYFADARGNVDLYKDFYERVRTSPDKETAGEQQLEFVRSMCDLSGYDLTGFFKLWGYLTPVESHKNDKGVMQFRLTNEQIDNLIEDIKRRNYKPMNEKIEYICDSNWEIFKDKKTMKAGTATKKGTEITVSGSENVVAYEAFDGDRLIFATNKNSFRLDGEPKQLKVFALAYDGTKQELSVQ